MAIVFNCPGCSQPLSAEPQYAGMQVQCPNCNASVMVPPRASERSEPPRVPISRGGGAVPPPGPSPYGAGQTPPPYGAPPGYGAGQWAPAAGAGASGSPSSPKRTSGLAIAALVLCIIPFTFVIGIILAVVALVRLSSRRTEKGVGLAVAGLCIGVGLWGVVSAILFVILGTYGKTAVESVLVTGRVNALANACEAYHTDFDAYPTILDDPPNIPGSARRLSGCQNLRLALLGCARQGQTYLPRTDGPADDIDHYEISRTREPFFTYKPGELVSHDQVFRRDRSQDAAYGTIDVFVDHYDPPRPILYYRALPRYINPKLYEFDDNAVYCDPAKGETEARFWSVVGDTERKVQPGFILISAGPDRIYFTDDDITNLSR